ncbi:hypothetical protein [Streptomyces sp. NPDC046805]|uniref:hypothetical protein n=1 Tax=Streptomyces sp. NPDC046805 TaxID=3155134 RepID=UPI0033F9F6B9
MTAEQTAEVRESAVVLEYAYEKADMTDAVKVILRKRGGAGWIFRPALLVAVGVVGLATLALDLSRGESPLLGVMLTVWPALMLFYIPDLSARQSLKSNEHQGRLTATVDDEGVRITGAHADARSAWGSYGHYVETKRVFVLRGPHRAANCAIVLVKRGARTPADVERLRALLDRHLARA